MHLCRDNGLNGYPLMIPQLPTVLIDSVRREKKNHHEDNKVSCALENFFWIYWARYEFNEMNRDAWKLSEYSL